MDSEELERKPVETAPGKSKDELAAAKEHWEKSFHAVSEGMFIIDRDYTILQANKALCDLLGKRPENVVGLKCHQLIHGKDEPPDSCITCAAVREGRSASDELFEPFLEKQLFVSTDPSFDARGEVEFAIHIVRDITGRKRVEQELGESEAKYRSLIESLNEGVWSIDAQGYTVFTNRRMAEMLGYSVDEMLGKHLFDFMDDDGKRLAEENLERRKRGITEQHDFEFLKKDGSRVFASLETSPMLDANGEYAGALAGVMDVTARKASEEKILAAERKYRELAEALPQVIFETDRTGTITYTNRKGYELFGYTGDDYREGIKALQVIDPVDHERVAGAIGKMMDGRSEGAQREYLARRKDGSTFPCVAETALILDAEGNRAGIRGILTDITERKRVEEEREMLLHDVRERVKELDSLYGLSKLVEKPGISLDEILQGTVELMPASCQYPEATCVNLKLGSKEYRTGNHRETPWRLSSDINVHGMKEGELEVCYLERFPEADEGPFLREERYLIAAIAERLGRVVEWERAEESLRESEEALQNINAELDGFAHTVSHDLKGPLAAIKSASVTLDALLAMPPTDEMKADISEMAGVIAEGADRSAALINEVLALASAGQEPGQVSEVDIGEVVERVLSERSAVIAEKGIRMERSGNLGHVIASPTHVYQVFTNLIGNAIKHNESGNPVISIAYLGEDRTGGRRYLVRNNGTGIPPGNLKKVFMPFFKGEKGDTGIGLSTVEKIVKIYGGRIRAYNDGGACFEFVLRDYVGT